MATVRQVSDSYADGTVQFWYEYSSSGLVVSRFGCTNLSDQPAYGICSRDSDGLSIELTFPAGQETSVAAPSTPTANRFVLTRLANGKLSGLNIRTAYPAS